MKLAKHFSLKVQNGLCNHTELYHNNHYKLWMH